MVAMPHWPKPLKTNFIKYDLERITRLLIELGSPHLACPPVIHIAGTNGKGSTVANLKAIFHAAGLRYHVYTSPHLVEFNERIIVSSEKISDGYLFEMCEKVRLAAERIGLDTTFFEGTTAVAFLAFAANPADVLILETGMGGRLDATNVVPNPLLTIITPISFDHMEYLGPTLSVIAGEKAGIIKPHVPCIISKQQDEVMDVLLKKADLEQAPAINYEYDFGVEKGGKSFRFLSQYLSFDLPLPSLRGDHQIINSATTIAALTLGQNIFKFERDHFVQGLQNIVWPARIQQISSQQYAKFGVDGQIWLDGAHNQGGAETLACWVKSELKNEVDLIVGMTKNRDVVKFLSQFAGIYRNIYTVPVVSEPLSYSSELLSQLALDGNIKSIPCLSLEDALHKIGNGSQNILITGSLFLAADFFKLIGTKSL